MDNNENFDREAGGRLVAEIRLMAVEDLTWRRGLKILARIAAIAGAVYYTGYGPPPGTLEHPTLKVNSLARELLFELAKAPVEPPPGFWDEPDHSGIHHSNHTERPTFNAYAGDAEERLAKLQGARAIYRDLAGSLPSHIEGEGVVFHPDADGSFPLPLSPQPTTQDRLE
jgi:hypothetical protein